MKKLIIDIETAPNKVYAWGLFNQNIALSQIEEPGYTLCWAAKWYGKSKIYFNSIHQSSQEAMLEEIHGLLSEADAVIHYNGTKFDIPVLNGEFAQQGYEPPTPYHQIDLLRTVRQRFRLPSNKLDFVARHFGVEGKVQHKGMDLWNGCMEGNNKDWSVMERYNKQDVRMLEPLYDLLLPWIKNHPNHGLYNDSDRPVCPNCGSTHVVKCGIETTLTQQYQRYRCSDCSTPIRGRTTVLDSDKRKSILTQSKL